MLNVMGISSFQACQCTFYPNPLRFMRTFLPPLSPFSSPSDGLKPGGLPSPSSSPFGGLESGGGPPFASCPPSEEPPDELEVGVGVPLCCRLEVLVVAEPLFVVELAPKFSSSDLLFFFDPSTPPTTAMMMTMTRMAIAIMMIPFLVV